MVAKKRGLTWQEFPLPDDPNYSTWVGYINGSPFIDGVCKKGYLHPKLLARAQEILRKGGITPEEYEKRREYLQKLKKGQK